jgi:hypothetical protein
VEHFVFLLPLAADFNDRNCGIVGFYCSHDYYFQKNKTYCGLFADTLFAMGKFCHHFKCGFLAGELKLI